MKELYGLLEIEGNPSTVYHPQTDGQTERVNQEVEKYLQMFVRHQQDDWADWLLLVEFSYNNMVNEATGFTPFYLNHRRHPWVLSSDPVAPPSTPAGAYLDMIKKVAAKAEVSLAKAKESMKK
jgi:hypothetical protein